MDVLYVMNYYIYFSSLSVLSLIFLYLSFNVIKYRRKNLLLYGAGGNIEMKAAIRAQANFAEYVPLTMLLFTGLIYFKIPVWFFALLNTVFVLARCSHAIGVLKFERKDPPVIKPRFFGIVGTFLVILLSIIYILYSIVCAIS